MKDTDRGGIGYRNLTSMIKRLKIVFATAILLHWNSLGLWENQLAPVIIAVKNLILNFNLATESLKRHFDIMIIVEALNQKSCGSS